ncbi:ANTAR domain-containing protein [Amycolatopsis samaneae]|uniref:ANTAR domain-containing protein n=1 Tax=Amycolatopsis samaneae TaxID=664691 RepID=A0ABW5GE29_9PSEU
MVGEALLDSMITVLDTAAPDFDESRFGRFFVARARELAGADSAVLLLADGTGRFRMVAGIGAHVALARSWSAESAVVRTVPLRRRADTVGLLRLVCADRADSGALRATAALADAAAIGLLYERRIRERKARSSSLQGRLDRTVVIEQATGVLAERYRTGPAAGRASLLTLARTRRQPVEVAAAEVIASTVRRGE